MADFISYSKNIYDRYYKSKNILDLFIISSRNGLSFRQLMLSVVIGLSGSYCLIALFKSDPFDIIVGLVPIIITSVATIIGFLLISYTIIIVHVNKQNAFKDFSQISEKKGEPPLRLILLHFIFPSILFLSLFVFSAAVQLIVNLKLTNLFEIFDARMLNSIVVNLLFTHFLYSLFEIGNYFYNIYVYISSTAKKESEAYEMELFVKSGLGKVLSPEEKAHLTLLKEYYKENAE